MFNGLILAGVLLGGGYYVLDKALHTEAATRFFNSFDRITVPEPYCVLKTNTSGSHIEIFARSAERNDHHGLDQVSASLYAADGTPLKKGMTGTFASKAGNTTYLLSKAVRDGPVIDKYTSPEEYASVTITGWTQMDGSPGPVGTCSKVAKNANAEVGPVWKGMPMRNWRADAVPAAPLTPASL